MMLSIILLRNRSPHKQRHNDWSVVYDDSYGVSYYDREHKIHFQPSHINFTWALVLLDEADMSPDFMKNY
jgi:hypothetical protein